MRRTELTYETDLERWLAEFNVLGTSGAWLPGPPPAEQAIWETGESIARHMVERVARQNAQAWREVVSRGASVRTSRRIFAGLQREMKGPVGARVEDLVKKNARLVKALPEAVYQKTALFVARAQQQGLRSSSLVAELERRLPQLRRSEAKLLARSGVAQAATAVTRARAEGLGLRWYDWTTSEDNRVRPSHVAMDKVLVAWSNAPSPEALAGEKSYGHYHPGGTRWCRCISLPLVDLSEVSWPHKVYAGNAVSRMSRDDFEKFAGMPEAA